MNKTARLPHEATPVCRIDGAALGPTFLRIHWDVVPGAHKFLVALRPYRVIADPVSLTHDFTHLKLLNREDQRKQLREPAARGQTITAMYAARKLYGCSSGEAKKLVDSLRENEVPR